MTAAAWHPDPTGRHELRYWDGSQWTDHVSDQGVQSVSALYPEAAAESGQAEASQSSYGQSSYGQSDALSGSHTDALSAQSSEQSAEQPAEASPFDSSADVTAFAPISSAEQAPAQEQPWVGSPSAEVPAEQAQPEQAQPEQAQAYAAQPPSQPPAQAYGQQAQQPVQPYGGGQQAYGDGFAGISGELIDGRFSEISGSGAVLQNKRLLRVRITEPFMAKQGSMVAYQGNVNFAYQGGGAAKFLKKAFTGEGLSLMRVEGQGDVFLADAAHEVHILHLNNTGLSVNGNNVLGFSASLEWNVERVKGGSIAAGGLFNTTLRGTGWVAITTDGDPVVLNAAEAPAFADANALVAWSVQLQTSIRSTVSAGALIGRGSGEAFQVSFQGPGFVIVQPSEGAQVPPHNH